MLKRPHPLNPDASTAYRAILILLVDLTPNKDDTTVSTPGNVDRLVAIVPDLDVARVCVYEMCILVRFRSRANTTSAP